MMSFPGEAEIHSSVIPDLIRDLWEELRDAAPYERVVNQALA
jgi:hypothetical protein